MPFYAVVIKNSYMNEFNVLFGGSSTGSILSGECSPNEKCIRFSTLPPNILLYWLSPYYAYKLPYMIAMEITESVTEVPTELTIEDPSWEENESFYTTFFTPLLQGMGLME
jgi:hypothetical protein